MQPSPSSTRRLLKTLPGACQSRSHYLGLPAGGGWPSLTHLVQVPCGTSARAKVYRTSSPIPVVPYWRHPCRIGANESLKNSRSQHLVVGSRISRPHLLAV